RELTWLDLIAIAPELVKETLEASIHGHEYSPGPPMPERRAEVRALEAQIREIRRQHALVVDVAAALKPAVHLEHLRENMAERERGAARRAEARPQVERQAELAGTFNARAARDAAALRGQEGS